MPSLFVAPSPHEITSCPSSHTSGSAFPSSGKSEACYDRSVRGAPVGRRSSFGIKRPLDRLSLRTPRQCFVKCAFANDTVAQTSKFTSLYEVLGLQQNVSGAEIKGAYRQMARRYHPDVCTASDKEESVHLFLQAKEAYEILSDPERRADYDCSLLHPFCAQALGKGFSNTAMAGRKNRGNETARHEVSVAWQLQWKAQLSRLHLSRQQQSTKSTANESWGAKMRRENSC